MDYWFRAFCLRKRGALAYVGVEGASVCPYAMEATKSADDIIGLLRRANDSGKPPDPELQDLRSVNFIDTDLSGLDLTGCNFSGCEMSRCNLSEVRCPHANFDGANLLEARLDGAEFMGSTFRKANLTSCSSLQSSFVITHLSRPVFFHSNLDVSTFVASALPSAKFHPAKISPFRFLSSSFLGPDLWHAFLLVPVF